MSICREPPPWLDAYLHEFAGFPYGRFDDQVDSTAQFLDWFKKSGRDPGGIYGYYRMLAEEQRRRGMGG